MREDNKLRLYGHLLASDSDEPIELEEVTLVADPDVLEAIAKMISSAAAELRASPEAFDHRQFTLSVDETSSRDLVIANPRLVAVDNEPDG